MIKDILKGIEELKLVCPSSELIEVRMEQLEDLYTHIHFIAKEMNNRDTRIEALVEKVEACKYKIETLNYIAKCTLKHKSLDEYI